MREGGARGQGKEVFMFSFTSGIAWERGVEGVGEDGVQVVGSAWAGKGYEGCGAAAGREGCRRGRRRVVCREGGEMKGAGYDTW